MIAKDVSAEELASALFWANAVASAAILLVFGLRPAVRRVFGARAVYRLWLIVPVALLASFIPAHEPGTAARETDIAAFAPDDPAVEAIRATTRSAVTTASAWMATARASIPQEPDAAEVVMFFWLAGAVLLFARAVIKSRRVAADPTLGPALVGIFRPRLVLPQDFRTRFSEREQSLVLAHEAVHQASRDPLTNALIEVFRCLNWVNPLVHVAAFHARADQEIACDAAVVAQFPSERRVYAEALLKAQIASAYPPLGCAWPGRSPSLLMRRIEMLGRRSPGRTRAVIGTIIVAVLMGGTSYVAWAAQLGENSPPWSAQLAQNAAAGFGPVGQNTPGASAQQRLAAAVAPPPGLLTRLEAGRHTRYVEETRAGKIDIVFLGDSTTDFWRYPPEKDQWNRTGGKPEWDRRYARMKAVNFGVEGAHTRSLLWRLQNGELDGYSAKVFVLTPLGIADIANHHLTTEDAIAGNEAIVAEIRKRQPQAKILINSIPRGMHPADRDNLTQTLAAAAAKLADNRYVYYNDLSGRFIKPDGTLDDDLTGLNGGTLTLNGYVAWAEAMAPKLEALLR